MITWVQLNTQPVYSFYSTEAARAVADLRGLYFRRLLSIGPIVRPCSVSGESETANVSVQLNNSDGFLTQFFSMPPHRVRALVSGYHNGEVFKLFRGIVTRVTLNALVTIDIES